MSTLLAFVNFRDAASRVPGTKVILEERAGTCKGGSSRQCGRRSHCGATRCFLGDPGEGEVPRAGLKSTGWGKKRWLDLPGWGFRGGGLAAGPSLTPKLVQKCGKNTNPTGCDFSAKFSCKPMIYTMKKPKIPQKFLLLLTLFPQKKLE